MKKSILAALVIVFLVFASVLAFNEATREKVPEIQVSSFYLE